MRNSESVGNVCVLQLNTVRINPFVVGKVVESTENSLVLQNAHSIVFNEKGDSFNLMPMNPLAASVEEEIELHNTLIVSVVEADNQIADALRTATSGIEVAQSMPKIH